MTVAKASYWRKRAALSQDPLVTWALKHFVEIPDCLQATACVTFSDGKTGNHKVIVSGRQFAHVQTEHCHRIWEKKKKNYFAIYAALQSQTCRWEPFLQCGVPWNILLFMKHLRVWSSMKYFTVYETSPKAMRLRELRDVVTDNIWTGFPENCLIHMKECLKAVA